MIGSRVLGGMALGAASVLAATGPATASPAGPERRDDPSVCPKGQVCFWPEPHYKGRRLDYKPKWHICGETPHQPSRSIVNKTDQIWKFLQVKRCAKYDEQWPLNPGGAWDGSDGRKFVYWT